MPPQTVKRRVKRTFSHDGTTYLKGTIQDFDPLQAKDHDSNGLTEDVPKRPSKEAAQAAASKSKSAKASETKETTAKGADGLEDWPLAQSEESYLAQYGDDKNASDTVKERVKLAKARIKAGVSSGAA